MRIWIVSACAVLGACQPAERLDERPTAGTDGASPVTTPVTTPDPSTDPPTVVSTLPASPSAPDATAVDAGSIGTTSHTIDTADGVRSFDLVVPSTATTTPMPLVVVLHGHGGSARQSRGVGAGRSPMAVWVDIAEREGVAIAYPEGAVGSDDEQGWNDCRRDARANPTTDDVAFLAAVIDEVAGNVPVDRTSVFVVGVSNGGFMALRLAIERPDLVAGVVPVVASMASDSECADPTEPVSVMFVTGTDDPLVRFGGGQVPFRRGGVLPVPEAVDVWRRLAAVPDGGAPTNMPDLDADDGSTVTVARGEGIAHVWSYVVHGGGHTEPSRVERYSRVWTAVAGEQNHDIETAEEAWTFFRTISGR